MATSGVPAAASRSVPECARPPGRGSPQVSEKVVAPSTGQTLVPAGGGGGGLVVVVVDPAGCVVVVVVPPPDVVEVDAGIVVTVVVVVVALRAASSCSRLILSASWASHVDFTAR